MLFKSTKRHVLVIAPEGVALRAVTGGAEAYCPLPPGALGPAEASAYAHFVLGDPRALQEAIQEAVRRVGGVKQAHVALDGPIMRVLSLPLPYLPERDALRLAVQSEAERYRVFGGAELSLDFAVLNQEPEHLSLVFAALRRDFVDAIRAICAEAGIEVTSVEPLALALMRGVTDAPGLAQAEVPRAMLCAMGHGLDVAVWHEGRLSHWRSIYLDVAALRRGEGAVLDDALVEFQRTMIDVGARDWLLVNVPEPLAQVLSERRDLNVVARPMRGAGLYLEALDGAALYAPGAFPVALDLGPERVVTRRTFDNRQWGGILVAAALLGIGLGISIYLDARMRDQSLALSAVQDQTQQLQTEIAARSTASGGEAVLASAFQASVESTRLFGALRDLIPADAWLSETRMEPGKPLTLVGYAVSRTSPVAFAEALGRLDTLTSVTVPEIIQEEREGVSVYRFTITAMRRQTPGGARVE
ncbi:MAG TPA: PilN domain-containing protein [Pantanalinema sp.]